MFPTGSRLALIARIDCEGNYPANWVPYRPRKLQVTTGPINRFGVYQVFIIHCYHRVEKIVYIECPAL
jgi:hypothetical protein